MPIQVSLRKPEARMNLRFLLPALLVSITGAYAGGFGGPAAFRNGSPLPTGTDGTYQAIARATNLTGVMTWTISNGAQINSTSGADWVFFVDGQVLSGEIAAVIAEGRVAGVMNGGFSSAIPTNDDGTITLPLIFIVPGNAGAGEFNGTIDLNDPVAAFSGRGTISGTPARTDTIVFIQETTTGSPITTQSIAIPGSTLGSNEFKFRGTRVAVSTTTTSTTTTE